MKRCLFLFFFLFLLLFTACGKQTKETSLPTLTLTGDLQNATKETKITVSAVYSDGERTIESLATLKVQGASSQYYPKKNYNIEFLTANGKKNKLTLKNEWGAESKYCLKANYIDASHARNIVSARIYGKIVSSRSLNDPLTDAPNGGAIDGYPILVYHGNEFLGLYTLNIPKDEWMFSLSKEGRQAILMADDWTDATALYTPIGDDLAESGFDLEYCSTEKTEGTEWVVESFNKMVDFIGSNDGEAFRAGIGEYLHVERAIDTMLFTYAFAGVENIAKNILWVTFDGERWLPSVYDMDCTWGLIYHAESFYEPDVMTHGFDGHALFEKLALCFPDEVKARYFELRKTILSDEAIAAEFESFFDAIPSPAWEMEHARWKEIPLADVDHRAQILTFAKEHLALLDIYIDKLSPSADIPLYP